MIIGNKKSFAVEFTLFEPYSPLLEGTFAYWINMQKLGDDIVFLNDIIMSMIWINHDAGNRIYPKRISGNFIELYNEINQSIYESENFYNYPGRYDISINIPNGIGHYKVFYIEDSYKGCLIYKKKSDNDDLIKGFFIEKEVVDAVLTHTFEELNRLYELMH